MTAYIWLKRLFLTLTLLGLIASNVLTLTHSAFNTAASGLFKTAFGVTTVADAMNTKLRKQAAKVSAQKNAAKRFGRRMTTRTSKLVATSVAELPSGAIPMLGIPVLIAATAYEVKLACENLDDLNQLYQELDVEEGVDASVMENVCHPQLPTIEQLQTAAKEYFG